MINPISKSDISKLAYRAYGAARTADSDGNRNGTATRAEFVAGDLARPRAVAQILKVFDAALKAKGRTSAISPGDFYAYTKTLTAEIREVANTRGNKDGKLDDAELRLLSAPARALAHYHHEYFNPA